MFETQLRPCVPALARAVFACALSLLGLSSVADETGYQLGRGAALSDAVTVGGYFSTEYVSAPGRDELVLDDLAVLVYGELESRFSYLVELESVEVALHDFRAGESETNFPPTIERLYGDYKFSDHIALRAGKQITPIGYWNLQPINVLRETTSNPEFSYEMFPKFLTGIDLYGYTPFDEQLTYHLYLQGTGDMDKKNINIAPDRHVGLSLERRMPGGWQMGGSIGRFRTGDEAEIRYVQANARRDTLSNSLIAEGIVNRVDRPGLGVHHAKAAYLQGEHRFDSHHALIGRFEYFHDPAQRDFERMWILGYSYRPVYPVSLKFEYQWHDDSSLNEFLASFSVLF